MYLQTYACGWAGLLYDYYVMYFGNKKSPYLSIDEKDGLNIAVHSDDEVIDMQREVGSWIKSAIYMLKVSFHLCTPQ